MGLGYAIGNMLLATRKYDNWAEVIPAIVKRQEPAKIILRNGLVIKSEVALRFVVREIFFERVYNPPYLPIGDRDIVVDIGANNGVFSLFAAFNTHNAVHAFEPSPRNLGILRRNIAINRLQNVMVHGCAVSNKVGLANLFLSLADGQQNLLSEYIVPAKIEQYQAHTDLNYLISDSGKDETYIEVPTTTLQEIMDSNNLEQIDFLKLDCEGAEGPILQSTPYSYLKRIRKIALEFHDHLSELNHRDIQNILKGASFNIRLKWDKKSPFGYIYAWRP